jgi:hypothetical protein
MPALGALLQLNGSIFPDQGGTNSSGTHTSPSSTSVPSKSGGLTVPTAIGVGIVIGFMVFGLVLAVVLLIYRRKQRQSTKGPLTPPPPPPKPPHLLKAPLRPFGRNSKGRFSKLMFSHTVPQELYSPDCERHPTWAIQEIASDPVGNIPEMYAGAVVPPKPPRPKPYYPPVPKMTSEGRRMSRAKPSISLITAEPFIPITSRQQLETPKRTVLSLPPRDIRDMVSPIAP